MYANRGDDAFLVLGSIVEECVARLHEGKLKNFYILLCYTRDHHTAEKLKAARSAAEAALNRLCHGLGKSHEFAWDKTEKIAIREWKTSAARGRHRRMIIGYDASCELIYYSDPWGFQNDRHSMPMRAAFAMTLWMQAICPESFAHGEIVKDSR